MCKVGINDKILIKNPKNRKRKWDLKII